MGKIIIGIHGLENKPPQLILEMWWRKALIEGLRNNGYEHPFLKFALVYWADCLHDKPLNPLIKEENHPLYVKHPYIMTKEIQPPASTAFKQKVSDHVFGHLLSDKVFSKIPGLTNWFLRNNFKDFYIYFGMDHHNATLQTDEVIKHTIQQRLIHKLHEHQDDEILLIAHSMGAIIAYEVLKTFEKARTINTLVTIGSPLTLPFVSNQLKQENRDEWHNGKLRVPESISHYWYNLYDPEDKIARTANYSKVFESNNYGVRVEDLEIKNDYAYKGQALPHNVFGYLRNPHLSDIVNAFIEEGQPEWLLFGKRIFNRFFSLLGKR